MIVSINDNKKVIYVKKEEGEKKYYNESNFFYHLKKKLIELGFDVIKKLAYKDGNLVDDNLYYIRDRKYKFYIYNRDYCFYDAGQKFDEDGEITLYFYF